MDGTLDGTAEKIGACDVVGLFDFEGAIESEGMDDLDGTDEGFGEGAGVKTPFSSSTISRSCLTRSRSDLSADVKRDVCFDVKKTMHTSNIVEHEVVRHTFATDAIMLILRLLIQQGY
eukprot:scaffold2584_cov53-Attheya_sp.AAC.2